MSSVIEKEVLDSVLRFMGQFGLEEIVIMSKPPDWEENFSHDEINIDAAFKGIPLPGFRVTSFSTSGKTIHFLEKCAEPKATHGEEKISS